MRETIATSKANTNRAPATVGELSQWHEPGAPTESSPFDEQPRLNVDLPLEISSPEKEAIARAREEERARKETALQDEFATRLDAVLLHAQAKAETTAKLEEDLHLVAAKVARDVSEFDDGYAKQESNPLAAMLHEAELSDQERRHLEGLAEAIEYVRRFVEAQSIVEMRLGDGMLTPEEFRHQRAQQPATEVDVGKLAEGRGLAAVAEARQKPEEEAGRAVSQRLTLEEEARKAGVARHDTDEKAGLAAMERRELEEEARVATVALHEADEKAHLAAEERRRIGEQARLVSQSWVDSDEKSRLAVEGRHGAEKRVQPAADARIVEEQRAHKAAQRRFDAEAAANDMARALELAETPLNNNTKPPTWARDSDSIGVRSDGQALLSSRLADGLRNLAGSQPQSGGQGGLWASAALVAVLAALGAGYWWGQSTAPATSAALPLASQSVPARLLDGPEPALTLRFEREPDIPKPAKSVK